MIGLMVSAVVSAVVSAGVACGVGGPVDHGSGLGGHGRSALFGDLRHAKIVPGVTVPRRAPIGGPGP